MAKAARLCPGGRVYVYPSRLNRGTLDVRLREGMGGCLEVTGGWGTLVSEVPPKSRTVAVLEHRGDRVVVLPPGYRDSGDVVDLRGLEETLVEHLRGRLAPSNSALVADPVVRLSDNMLAMSVPLGLEGATAPVAVASPETAVAVTSDRYLPRGTPLVYVVVGKTLAMKVEATGKGTLAAVNTMVPTALPPHPMFLSVDSRYAHRRPSTADVERAVQRVIRVLRGDTGEAAMVVASPSAAVTVRADGVQPLLRNVIVHSCGYEDVAVLHAKAPRGAHVLEVQDVGDCHVLVDMFIWPDNLDGAVDARIAVADSIVETNMVPRNVVELPPLPPDEARKLAKAIHKADCAVILHGGRIYITRMCMERLVAMGYRLIHARKRRGVRSTA